MIKVILVAIFLIILASLGTALFHLIKPKDDTSSEKLAKALTFRIGISVLLFIIVLILLVTGVVKPHGISSRIHSQKSISEESAK